MKKHGSEHAADAKFAKKVEESIENETQGEVRARLQTKLTLNSREIAEYVGSKDRNFAIIRQRTDATFPKALPSKGYHATKRWKTADIIIWAKTFTLRSGSQKGGVAKFAGSTTIAVKAVVLPPTEPVEANEARVRNYNLSPKLKMTMHGDCSSERRLHIEARYEDHY